MPNSLYESSASETEDDHPTKGTPTPKPRNKRPASMSPKGDIEAQSQTPTRPNKKPKENRRYSPEWDIEETSSVQQDPKNAPAVTITNAQGSHIANRAQAGRRLSFGSIDEDANSHTSSKPPTNMQPSPIIEKREKRQLKPSQKALYMQEEAHHRQDTHRERQGAINSSTKRDSAPSQAPAQSKSSKGKEKSKETSARDEYPPVPQTPRPPSRIPRMVKDQLPPNVVSEVKIHIHEEPQRSYQYQQEDIVNEMESTEEHEMGMRWKDDPNGSIHTTSTPEGHVIVRPQYKEHPPPERVEPVPKQTKSSIPPDPEVKYEPCLLEAFQTMTRDARDRGEKLETDSSLPSFAAVYLNLKDDDDNPFGARNLRRFYAFTGNKIAFNPARATEVEAGVQKESNNSNGGRIVQAGSGSNMLATSLIFFSSGLVASCNLIHATTTGVGSYSHNIKKIGVWLMLEEFDPMMSYFGKLYNRHRFASSYYADIIYFQTQRDGIVPTPRASSSAQSSPKKSAVSGVFAKRSPVKVAGTPVPSLNNPPFLKYSEDVPIYDTRAVNFQITPESIANIHNLIPRYNGGLVDLNNHSVVTVGYTVNAYPYNQAPAEKGELPRLCLSFNVQFVLYHGRLEINPTAEVLAED